MAKSSKAKKMKKELLAYCGIYCGDCLGHTGVIADAAEDFKCVLEKYEFEKSVKYILSNQLKNYDKIFDKIVFMASLRCPIVCRERTDDNVDCEIRKCCRSKGFFACYQCDNFKNCEKLKSMEGLHYKVMIKNLKEIKERGLEKWIKKGKAHHYWDKGD
jgi:hypothetical protein